MRLHFKIYFSVSFTFTNFEQLNLVMESCDFKSSHLQKDLLIYYLMQRIDFFAFSNVFFGFFYIFPILKQLNLGNWNELSQLSYGGALIWGNFTNIFYFVRKYFEYAFLSASTKVLLTKSHGEPHCKPIPCNENRVFPVYFFSGKSL